MARRLRRHWALAAVCAAFLVAGALALDNYDRHISDGDALRLIGNAALDYLAGDGERAFDQLNYFSDRYYGAVVEAPFALLERALGRDGARIQHILMHLFFLAGGVCCYLLVLRLFGSRLLALAAMVLFLLHPRIYAHSFYNSKDIPFLVTFMIALYLMHRAFRRETLGAFILCGAVVGLLANLRVMGIILFAAVLALRALDLAFSGQRNGGRPWRATAGTAGAFALAAMLTYHASLPVLWTDPPGRFADLIAVQSSHPHADSNLFRGEWLYSRYGPPLDYVPVWVAITTPPATLLLAATGALALAWRGLRRPREALRNGPTRFGLLLVVLPVAVTVAVVARGSNIHDTWRHLFFLYAPLSLLAVCGLHALLRAGRGRWPRAGAYALAGAAIAVAVVSMVRIHPHERLYFTLLTDRTTPGRLAFDWEIVRWSREYAGATFANVAGDYPSGPLYVSSLWSPGPDFPVFPAEDRERFALTRAFRSGERNFLETGHEQWCPDLPGTRARRLYSLLLHCVVDPVAYLGGYRRQALATEPLARSRFDAYRVDDVMVYVRDDCSPGDMELRFFLRVHPVAVGKVPDRLQEFPGHRGAYGFEKRDFAFTEYGAGIDGNCVAVVRLPDYPIARIETGQFTPEYAAAARRAVADATPRAHSRFDVWLDEDARTLTWVREGCTAEDMGERFIIHVYPVNTGDLPDWREEHGFDNFNFQFEEHGVRLEDGSCVVVTPLPAYAIASVQTSQAPGYVPWAARFAFSPPRVDTAALAGEPLARAVFAIHRHGDALVYVKDTCGGEDAQRAFFLHLYPVDEADLPADSREHGFENRDFHLWERGGLMAGDRCIAVAPLPDYPVASVHTGQYDEEGRHWEARFPLVHGAIGALAREPLVRAIFDVWRDGDALVYVKEGCTEEDAAAAFFLHLYPVDEADLPADAREHGFENRDFLLWQRGGRAAGRCVAVMPLPDYPIASVRTGQYDATGRLWWTEFALPR